MFIPNRTSYVSRLVGTDLYGERKYARPIQVPCAVVHLNKKALKTTVRADSSASRGSGDEFISVSKILFPSTVSVGVEDKVEVSGYTLKATTIEPRYAVDGRLDHYEIDLEHWV